MTVRSLARAFSVISFTFLLASCAQSSETRAPEKYVLPEGYVGSFHVVFEIKSGEPQAFDSNTREYRIPETGLLLVQSSSNPGRIASDQIRFYYMDEKGDETPIKGRWTTTLHDTPENRADSQTYVFGGGISEIQPVRHCRMFSKTFYVGTKSQALENRNQFDIYSTRGIGSVPESVLLESCQ